VKIKIKVREVASFDIAAQEIISRSRMEVNSKPRRRVIDHVRKLHDQKSTVNSSTGNREIHVQASCRPLLQAGDYEITAKQKVWIANPTEEQKAMEGNKELVINGDGKRVQKFSVSIPQFSLPPGVVHSCYPPNGSSALSNVLPHIVFNDPHLPWERKVSDKDITTPWLALLVFHHDELELAPSALEGVFGTPASQHTPRQSSTGSFRLSVGGSDKTKTRTYKTLFPTFRENSKDPDHVDVIFLTPQLFTNLFSMYETNGQLSAMGAKAYVERYSDLAHVKCVNTTNMAKATSGSGKFSVVVSHRTGPIAAEQSTNAVVHLVSLQGVRDIDIPVLNSGKILRVGLVSLQSWTYTCVHKEQDDFEALLAQMLTGPFQYLRANDKLLRSMKHSEIRARIELGYSLVKYRLHSGETTVAYYRGPLVPTHTTRPAYLPASSDQAIDLKVMDCGSQIVDVSYSCAWQLGRSLGVANRSFRAALCRLRACIHLGALEKLFQTNQSVSNAAVYPLLETMTSTTEQQATRKAEPEAHIGRSPTQGIFDGSTFNGYKIQVAAITQKYASTRENHSAPFTELNAAYNPDWAIILKFTLDRLFLAGIPSHYLITNSSCLPSNALRFFHIDRTWLDVMIDGVLSIGNHIFTHEDPIRLEIKRNINRYLTTSLFADRNYLPQIPTFGFLLHSPLVHAYPDIRITAPFPDNCGKAPVVLLDHLEDEMIIVLFDREPGHPDMKEIKFEQPEHQLHHCFKQNEQGTEVYDLSNRTVIMTNYLAAARSTWGPEDLLSKAASSVLAARQLGQSLAYGTLMIPMAAPVDPSIVQLWIGENGKPLPELENSTNPSQDQSSSSIEDNPPFLLVEPFSIQSALALPRRPPHLPRIRKWVEDVSMPNELPELAPTHVSFRCGLQGKRLDNIFRLSQSSSLDALDLSVSWTQGPTSRVYECIVVFRVAYMPNEIPLLEYPLHAEINVTSGVVGNARGWFGVILEESAWGHNLIVRFIAKHKDNGFTVAGTHTLMTVVKNVKLEGRVGQSDVAVYIIQKSGQEGMKKKSVIFPNILIVE
jgi:hypothetical protein